MAKARIDITGNSQSFEQAARRVNVDLMKMNSNAQETGQAMSAFGNKTKAALAGIVSTAAITPFVKQMATVRGQFQQYEIALSTMLQSEEKAAALMGELVGLAAKTPFNLQGVVEGAKQLMAYGTAAEDMTETLTMLGDVAAGLSIPLGDLVYLYGTTMTQGRMYTMDLRQFMARGIPMAEELAKQFGVTKDAVSELVTEGKVGAEDMKKALQSMTSEGGKFHNLMEAQSASITGQLSNLTDKIQTAYNELGKKNEGIIYDAIKGASYLVEHYEEIGKVLIGLIATYGAYKAAVIACAAAQKVVAGAQNIAAFLSLTKSIKSAKDAMLLLNMATGASTIGVVAAAIAALTTVIVLFNRKAKETNTEIEAIDSATKKATEKFAEEKAKIEALNTILHDTNQSYKERKRALDEIQQLAPDYHAKLTTEGELINDNTQSIEDHVKSLEKDIQAEMLRAEIVEQIRQREMEMETARERIARGYQVLVSAGASGAGFQVQNWVTQAYTEAEAQEILTEAYNNRQSAIDALTKKLAELFSSDSKTAQKSKQLSKEELEELKKKKEQKQKIQEEYDKWLLDATNAANDELVNLQLQAERDRVDAMAEGASKRKAQFSLEQKEAIIEMQRYVRNVLNEQAKLEKNKGMSIGYGTFEVGADGTLAYKLAESGLTLTPEQQNVINEMVRKFNQDIVDTWVTEVTDLDIDSGYNLADKLLEQLDEDMIAGLANGGFSSLKEQASIIFADISELSSDMIQQIISNAEEYINTPGLTDEAIAKYREAIDKANEYLVKNDPWAALKIAQERYVKAVADYNKATEDYNTASNADDKKAKAAAIKEQNAAILEQAQALSIVRQAYDALRNAITGIVGNVGSLFEEMGVDGEVFEGIKQMIDGAIKMAVELAKLDAIMKSLADTSKDTGEEVSDMASNIGGALTSAAQQTQSAELAIIGLFIQIITAIVKIGNASNKASEELRQSKIDEYVEKVDKRIEKLTDDLDRLRKMTGIGDSWFTEDLYNNIVQTERAITKAQESFLDVFARISEAYNEIYAGPRGSSGGSYSTDGMQSAANNLLALLKEVKNIVDQISGADLGDSDIFSRFGLDGLGTIDAINEAIAQLKELEATYKAEGWEKLAADAKEAYENLEEYLTAYEELKSTVTSAVGDISGNILSTVNSMWKEIREGGETTFADLTAAAKKNISEVIDQMVSQQLWATTMSKYFDQLGVDLTAAIAGGGDPSAILGVFDTFWTGMEAGLKDYTKYYEAFLQKAEERGWDMTSGNKKEENPAAGSIKAMRDELSRLQEQWDNLTDAERKSKDGEELFGSIKDLEDKIEAAENLYSTTRNIAGSINDINSKLSELNAEWDSISPEDREGAYGAKIKADIAYYEQLLNDAESLHQSELASLQSLIDSKEAKYDLYQKWIELYGDETATRMMGDMLTDAEAYLNELRNGISELQEKVTAGTATDEEISQLSAWEQQYADIQRAAAEAAEEAAGTAYEAWNEALDKQLDKAKTDYEKLAVLQDEYLNAVAQAAVAQGTDKTYADQYVSELEAQIAQLEAEVESNLREKYKTEAQEREEALQGYKEDMEYAGQVLQDMDLVAEIRRQRDEYLSGLANVALESSEEYQLIFGDLQEVSADAFNAAMGNIRKTVEESTELTAEAKANLLKLLDEVQDKWDDLQAEKELDKVKEKFSDIQSIMGSVSGLLEEMGVSDTFSQMFNGLQTIIEGYGQLKVAIETARVAQTAMNMATAFGAIATIITGLIRSVGTLVNRIFTITDIEGPLQGLVDTYDKLTKAIDRSVGAQRKARQEEAARNLKDQKAELERDYAKEASKWGFSFTILGKKIQILGPDQGVLDELASQIEEVDAAMQQLGDTMKYDFLQTDYESFADSLSDILTQPYDSFEDMMNAVDDLVDTTLDRITQKWLTTNFLQGKIETALENLYAAGDPSAEAYERYRQAVKEASEYYLQEAEKLGIGTYSSGSANSDYDTIRRISAEDFSKWLGEWRAQRIALVDNGNVLKNIYDQLKTMSESPAADPELLELTRKIESNTAVLPEYLPRILEAMKGQNNLKAYGY